MSAPTTEDSDQPKGSGRRKLQGVLDELVQQSKEAEDKLPAEIVEDAAIEEAAKSLVELPNSLKAEDVAALRRKGYGSLRKKKRRRKKELVPTSDDSDSEPRDANGRHIPHVMTLFDRKVDLAWFTDSTPLYVMCREWMRNNPQRRRSRSASVEQEATDVQDSHSFPSPEPMPEGQRSDIPEALPPHSTKEDLDHHLEKQSVAVSGEGDEHSPEVLKKEHLQRWKSIKSRWKAASLSDQDRYKDSLKILRDMFQR